MVGICVDVSDIESVEKVVKSLGPVHLLVNNAGVSHLQSFLDITAQEYDR